MTILVRTSYWRRIFVGALASRVRMSGAIRLDGDSLVLDYRERRRNPATLRMGEGPPRRVSVATASVDVDMDRDWLRRPLLVVRTHVFDGLRGWPGAHDDRCVFRITRDPSGKQVEAAGELVLRLADAQLRALDEPESSR
ncbi:MAG TPA: hypothetical protein VM076_08565 [Gemmatimonadaceae bacterium]|nr:hypothetical protein [Gemmatimonadaceae bacterium]